MVVSASKLRSIFNPLKAPPLAFGKIGLKVKDAA
jgi:hypothetical protein